MHNQKNRQGNRQGNRQSKNIISTLAGLIVFPCLLVDGATPLQSIEPTTQAYAAVIASSIAAEQTCEFFSAPQRYNTQSIGADGRDVENSEDTATDTTVVIGPHPNRPYGVIIPGGDVASLRILRVCILDAFVSQSHFGPYLHVGSFGRRNEAEGLKRILTREGYPARVIYQR